MNLTAWIWTADAVALSTLAVLFVRAWRRSS
jgi:hypothetical protein